MGTVISELITDWALVEINDIRLDELLKENPALLLRKMWLYVKNAVPYFNNPPQMREWLRYTAPKFDSYEWTAEASASESVVETGLTGFSLMSVSKIWIGSDGAVLSCPYYEANYDAETGNVTFPPGIADGTQFSVDFYADGSFENDLGPEELRILGKCVALVWYEHFAADWLNMQPKITDKSFSTGSEANHTNAQTTRVNAYRAALNDEIRRYAQNVEYRRLDGIGALRGGSWM